MLYTPDQIADIASSPEALADLVETVDPMPASNPDLLSAIVYSVRRIHRLAAENPALLYVISEDLAEIWTLVVPAAEVLDDLAAKPTCSTEA